MMGRCSLLKKISFIKNYRAADMRRRSAQKDTYLKTRKDLNLWQRII